jgi:hypothetical protein
VGGWMSIWVAALLLCCNGSGLAVVCDAGLRLHLRGVEDEYDDSFPLREGALGLGAVDWARESDLATFGLDESLGVGNWVCELDLEAFGLWESWVPDDLGLGQTG